MASPFQQQSRVRKLIYFGVIVGLFSVSLLFRRFVLETEAMRLALREQNQGEVQLTDSALRLTLSGSRGLVVCYLWNSAIEKQKKHEWNELQLLVRSLTRLQPHFITPWLFQSWNLAFNVSVECDRTRDKYYYITEGIRLLAEGERRNRGNDNPDPEDTDLRFPGSPKLRFYVGFYYQLKVGQGDEQNMLRSLFDLSCIDPSERDPEALWVPGKEGRKVDPSKFERFLQNNPRLVRRLRERLGHDSLERVVTFLSDSKDVPSRFQKPRSNLAGDRRETPLLPADEQFPVLPPRTSPEMPDANDRNFGGENFDVFTAGKAWFLYAMAPLPPPNPDPGVRELPFDPTRYRLPDMSAVIFRGYPARGQAFVAEFLEKEGWFDETGWTSKWLLNDPDRGDDTELVAKVGTESKYHAGPAWDKAYQMYLEYGIQNGLYFPPRERQALEDKARLFRTKFKVKPGLPFIMLRPDQRGGGLGESFDAHMKLDGSARDRAMTNYDSRLVEAEVERTREAVTLRRYFYEAERLRREAADPQALARYEQAWPRWRDLLLQYPEFRRIGEVQQDTYESQMKYLRLLQNARASLLRPLTIGIAQMAFWPPVLDFAEQSTDERKKQDGQKLRTKIIPIRMVQGPFELLWVYDGPHSETLKRLLPAVANLGRPWPYLPLDERLLTAAHKNRILTATRTRDLPPGEEWRPFIEDENVRLVRDRLGLPNPPRPTAAAVPPPGGMPPRPKGLDRQKIQLEK
jgi:hypothetical protein